MIYSIVQIYMKPSQYSRLQYKNYTTHDEVQKEENVFSNVYLVPKKSLNAIQSYHEIIRRMKDDSVMDCHDIPDMSFEVISEAARIQLE